MRLLRLSTSAPIASGATRDVYLHPEDDRLLVKVVPPDVIERRYERGRPWYKTRRRYRHFVSYLREAREHIALRAQCKGHPRSLQHIVGFADTDLGFGLVVEAAKDREGKLAPTLPQLIAEGRFDTAARNRLQNCLEELIELPVVLGDLHTANFVYAWAEEHGDHFVLIDGIGCKNLIPFNRMSLLINRRSKRSRIRRFLADVEILIAEAAERRPAAHAAKSLAAR
jgi:hypothetical protein